VIGWLATRFGAVLKARAKVKQYLARKTGAAKRRALVMNIRIILLALSHYKGRVDQPQFGIPSIQEPRF